MNLHLAAGEDRKRLNVHELNITNLRGSCHCVMYLYEIIPNILFWESLGLGISSNSERKAINCRRDNVPSESVRDRNFDFFPTDYSR